MLSEGVMPIKQHQADQRDDVNDSPGMEMLESASTWLTERLRLLPEPPTLVYGHGDTFV